MAKNRKTPDMNLPVWFDGQNINEALFCEEFLHERRIIFANGAFFTPDGRVTDDLPLRGEIYDKLKFCAVNNIPRKITNILEVLKLEAQVPDFPPEQDRIHLSNGTLLLNGTFTEGRPAIVRSRLPVVYNPDAPAPVIWLNFLNGLLHAEDIPTLQEFIGYCLIPSNKGQRMMVIKGNGGEGKSQIGAVLSAIFGTNMKDGSIGKISENRFARADLEHILLCVDAKCRIYRCGAWRAWQYRGTSDCDPVQGAGRTAAAGSCDRAGGTGRTEFGGCQSCHSKTEKETGIFAKGNQGGKDHCADSAGH